MVKFSYDDGIAHSSVQVAGEFNSWSPVNLHHEQGTRYSLELDVLDRGRFMYKYIVDGEWRLSGKEGEEVVDDGMGNSNHIATLVGDSKPTLTKLQTSIGPEQSKSEGPLKPVGSMKGTEELEGAGISNVKPVIESGSKAPEGSHPKVEASVGGEQFKPQPPFEPVGGIKGNGDLEGRQISGTKSVVEPPNGNDDKSQGFAAAAVQNVGIASDMVPNVGKEQSKPVGPVEPVGGVKGNEHPGGAGTSNTKIVAEPGSEGSAGSRKRFETSVGKEQFKPERPLAPVRGTKGTRDLKGNVPSTRSVTELGNEVPRSPEKISEPIGSAIEPEGRSSKVVVPEIERAEKQESLSSQSGDHNVFGSHVLAEQSEQTEPPSKLASKIGTVPGTDFSSAEAAGESEQDTILSAPLTSDVSVGSNVQTGAFGTVSGTKISAPVDTQPIPAKSTARGQDSGTTVPGTKLQTDDLADRGFSGKIESTSIPGTKISTEDSASGAIPQTSFSPCESSPTELTTTNVPGTKMPLKRVPVGNTGPEAEGQFKTLDPKETPTLGGDQGHALEAPQLASSQAPQTQKDHFGEPAKKAPERSLPAVPVEGARASAAQTQAQVEAQNSTVSGHARSTSDEFKVHTLRGPQPIKKKRGVFKRLFGLP